MQEVLVLALAGAAGTLSRYAVSGWAHRLLGERFAYGTFAVNLIGSFLLGLLMQIGLTTDIVPRSWRVPLSVGFLGAFTTFSTFGYETVRFLEQGAWLEGAINVTANLVVCLAATWAGLSLGRLVTGVL